MRGPLVFNVVVCAALSGFCVTARGDVGSGSGVSDPIAPGWRMTQPDPGPATALWHRGDLTDAERAYVDGAAHDPNAEAINTAYASAMTERAAQAAIAATTEQLGLENLGGEGVVP